MSMAKRSLSTLPSSSTNDPDAPLRGDIKKLGTMLGNIIQVHSADVYEAVEKLRPLGREWRLPGGDGSAFDKMVKEVQTYDANKLSGVARAFTHFLALSNSAENHHRIRRLRMRMVSSQSALSPKEDSCAGAIRRLVNEKKVSKDDVLAALSSQCVEIVLTAHPTEVNRRTMLQKHQRIKKILETLDRSDSLTPFEIRQLNKSMYNEVASIWESDELRRSKPTPVDEAKAGLAVVENVLWHAVPQFLRKLDDVARQELGKPLPLHIAPLKVASWMGGDRDGNPNVTPSITYEVSTLSRRTAAVMFKEDIAELHMQLSIKPANAELQAASGNAREPYRAVLHKLEQRLQATIDHMD